MPPDPEPAPDPDQSPDQNPDRLSHALERLIAQGEAPRIAVADLLHGLESRAHAALLILFALPNTLPGLPGTSAVLGVLLLFLTLQQALARPPWLPQMIARRSVRRASLQAILTRALPWLRWVETCLHPRLPALTRPGAERAIGAVSVLLSLVILLPIPLGNMMPALAIICFSLGLMERDGIWVLIGAALSLLSAALIWTLLWALLKSAAYLILHWVG